MSEIIRKIQEKGMEQGIEGVIGAVPAIAHRELKERVAGYAKFMEKIEHFAEGLLDTGIGLVGIGFDLPYVDNLVSFGVYGLLKGAYKHFFKKDPFIYVDGSKIEGWNFDANDKVTIVVDGTTLVDPSSQTPVSTDANGYFSYTPSTALSAGVHDVLVRTTNKAVFGKFPV